MKTSDIAVMELVAAFEQPIERLDLWLSWAPAEVAEHLRTVVESIGADDDVLNLLVARLILGWSESRLTVSEIAKLGDVSSPAVSQRKKLIQNKLDKLFGDPVLSNHPLVELWRYRAARCVRIEDLPNWMTGFLVTGEGDQGWGVPEDVFWMLLRVVMRRPQLVEADGSNWLVDIDLDERGDSKNRVVSIFESFADRATANGSVVLGRESFETRLLEFGVSPLSIESFSTSLARVARRSVSHGQEVLILNETDAKNALEVTKAVIDLLGVERSAVAQLLAEQHGRQPKSIANKLGRV